MKNLTDYLDDVGELSGKASDVLRQFALGGIAITWIFKGSTTPILPSILIWALGYLATGLAIDFLHYFSTALMWSRFHSHHENRLYKEKDKNPKIDMDPVIDHPDWMVWPSFFFFWLKAISVILGYICIIKYLIPLL